MTEDDPTGAGDDRPKPSPEDSNVVRREAVVRGHPECPLCGRQLAVTSEHLVAFSPEEPTPKTADAVACPVCDGVSFVVE